MRWTTLGVCGILTLSLVGCGVSKDKYTQMEREKQQLEERTSRLLREKEGLASAIEDLEAENQRLTMENQQLQALQQDKERARMDAMKQAPAVSQEPQGTLDADYK